MCFFIFIFIKNTIKLRFYQPFLKNHRAWGSVLMFKSLFKFDIEDFVNIKYNEGVLFLTLFYYYFVKGNKND